MKVLKRNLIFISAGIVTFAFAVWLTPVKQPHGLVLENLLVVKHSPWLTLRRFENQDLLGLDEYSTSMVAEAVAAITGRRYETESSSERFQPALFRSMLNTKGEKRYILVEQAQIGMIPGKSSLRIHVFDSAGSLHNTQVFSAGSRRSIGSMRVRDLPLLRQPLLLVDTEYFFGGLRATQYYALIRSRMVLVYHEQDQGVDHNDYETSPLTVLSQFDRSIDEWERDLAGPNEAEVLSALVWLNSYHLEQALRSHAGLQERLRELSQSENPWIKAAAESVLENIK